MTVETVNLSKVLPNEIRQVKLTEVLIGSRYHSCPGVKVEAGGYKPPEKKFG